MLGGRKFSPNSNNAVECRAKALVGMSRAKKNRGALAAAEEMQEGLVIWW
jgi:hypothetical protein